MADVLLILGAGIVIVVVFNYVMVRLSRGCTHGVSSLEYDGISEDGYKIYRCTKCGTEIYGGKL